MTEKWQAGLRERLVEKRNELQYRLTRIEANVRQSLDSDSEERAKQLEDRDVVDALGNETREELKKIAAALSRMEAGDYGICDTCGATIPATRMEAWPYATHCIDCAELEEMVRSRA